MNDRSVLDVMRVLQTKIDVLQKKLEGLREEFDRLDANHPQQSIQVMRDISRAAGDLASLLEFQRYMQDSVSNGPSAAALLLNRDDQ